MRKLRALLFFLVLLLTACNQSNEPTLEGDKLIPPKTCWVYKNHVSSNLAVPSFKRFDQNYPAGWPDGFEFPAETYIKEGTLQRIPAQNPDFAAKGWEVIQVRAFVKIGKNEIREYLKEQVSSAGFSISKEQNTAGFKDLMGTMPDSPPSYSISTNSLGKINQAICRAHLDPGLTGYTYISVQFTYVP